MEAKRGLAILCVSSSVLLACSGKTAREAVGSSAGASATAGQAGTAAAGAGFGGAGFAGAGFAGAGNFAGLWCDACHGICGDRALDPYEQCDDGNSNPGDGCTPNCQIEDGCQCDTTGVHCSCAICGDGVWASSETCDDGNTQDLDGCTADCLTIEPGWTCSVAGRPCQPTQEPEPCPSMPCGVCGDGVVSVGEACDQGNANADSLYGGCTTACTRGPRCGDTFVNGPEECDFGPLSGFAYGAPNMCTAGCRWSHYCGDGRVDAAFGETCDLGAANNAGSICDTNCHYTPK